MNEVNKKCPTCGQNIYIPKQTIPDHCPKGHNNWALGADARYCIDCDYVEYYP